MLKSASGAMIVVNETGIYISNGKGATITLIGPTVAINDDRSYSCRALESRAESELSGDMRLPMPGPILHMGATVICSHGGSGDPDRAEPVVFVSGMPIATIAAPYAIAGCAFVPPAGNGPCVTGQWVVGATRVLSQGSRW